MDDTRQYRVAPQSTTMLSDKYVNAANPADDAAAAAAPATGLGMAMMRQVGLASTPVYWRKLQSKAEFESLRFIICVFQAINRSNQALSTLVSARFNMHRYPGGLRDVFATFSDPPVFGGTRGVEWHPRDLAWRA